MIKKKPIKFYDLIIRFALALSKHALKMPVLANTLFGSQFSFSQYFEQRNCSLLRFFLYDSNSYMFLYSRTRLSDKQSKHSFSPTTF